MVKKLIFVYNANSGLFSSITDSLHKSFSPKTYQCNLCTLTFGAVKMKKEWKKLIDSLSSKVKVDFLHKDEFSKKYEYKTSFPIILEKNDDKLSVFITTEKLNKIKSLQELIKIVKNKSQ